MFCFVYSSEMYHAVRWHNDFAAPMTTLSDNSCLFVNNFLSFKHPNLGIVNGKLLKCFLKVSVCKSLLYLQ